MAVVRHQRVRIRHPRRGSVLKDGVQQAAEQGGRERAVHRRHQRSPVAPADRDDQCVAPGCKGKHKGKHKGKRKRKGKGKGKGKSSCIPGLRQVRGRQEHRLREDGDQEPKHLNAMRVKVLAVRKDRGGAHAGEPQDAREGDAERIVTPRLLPVVPRPPRSARWLVAPPARLGIRHLRRCHRNHKSVAALQRDPLDLCALCQKHFRQSWPLTLCPRCTDSGITFVDRKPRHEAQVHDRMDEQPRQRLGLGILGLPEGVFAELREARFVHHGQNSCENADTVQRIVGVHGQGRLHKLAQLRHRQGDHILQVARAREQHGLHDLWPEGLEDVLRGQRRIPKTIPELRVRERHISREQPVRSFLELEPAAVGAHAG
eukprot:scaffold1503_cov250-Pinguiococcus_pyrenoidosus.AAC.11